MNKITDFLKRPVSYKTVLILLSVILFLLVFPLLYIGKWNVPSADDYSDGIYIHDALLNGAGFAEIVKVVIDRSLDIYQTWQGSMTGNILCTLQPAAFGEQYYAIVPYIMIISLIIGVCVLVVRIFMIFSAKKYYGLIIAISILIVGTQFLPSPVQGFYWYTGAVYYTFLFAVSLLFYTLLIDIWYKPETDKAVGKEIAACFLSVVIAFSNYTTALTTAILLVSIPVFSLLKKNGKWKYFILPNILYLISFYFNLTAPGNISHINAYAADNGLVRSLYSSFEYALTQILTWNRVPVIAIYIFLSPLLWKIAVESGYSFKLPWLVSLYSYCLFASMNFPTYYAGSEHGGRVENIRYFALLILFIFNLFYWYGWLGRNHFKYIGRNHLQPTVSFLIGIFCLFTIGMLNILYYRITTFSAVQSYYLGHIGQYKHVFNQRLEILKDPEISDAVLREFPRKRPFVLYFDDISRDPNDWKNIAMSEFFHKDSVRLRMEDEELPVFSNQQ